MRITLFLLLIASLLLTGCLSRRIKEMEESVEEYTRRSLDSGYDVERFDQMEQEIKAEQNKYFFNYLDATEGHPRIYFLRLLTPLKELTAANWSKIARKYVMLPQEDEEWMVIFVGDNYDLPIGTKVVELSENIPYEEFMRLNHNLEGWTFVRLHERKVELERLTDKGNASKTLAWSDFEKQFPNDIILESWSHMSYNTGAVFVRGVSLTGRENDTIIEGVVLSELDADRVLALATSVNRKITVYTDRDVVQTKIERLVKLGEEPN